MLMNDANELTSARVPTLTASRLDRRLPAKAHVTPSPVPRGIATARAEGTRLIPTSQGSGRFARVTTCATGGYINKAVNGMVAATEYNAARINEPISFSDHSHSINTLANAAYPASRTQAALHVRFCSSA